jgi:hypothetical protein
LTMVIGACRLDLILFSCTYLLHHRLIVIFQMSLCTLLHKAGCRYGTHRMEQILLSKKISCRYKFLSQASCESIEFSHLPFVELIAVIMSSYSTLLFLLRWRPFDYDIKR